MGITAQCTLFLLLARYARGVYAYSAVHVTWRITLRIYNTISVRRFIHPQRVTLLKICCRLPQWKTYENWSVYNRVMMMKVGRLLFTDHTDTTTTNAATATADIDSLHGFWRYASDGYRPIVNMLGRHNNSVKHCQVFSIKRKHYIGPICCRSLRIGLYSSRTWATAMCNFRVSLL